MSKNRQLTKSGSIPRWIDAFKKANIISFTQIVNEMNKRGCNINLSKFTKKSKISYIEKFSNKELTVLTEVKKHVLKELRDFINIWE